MTGGYVFVNGLIFWATRVSFGGLTGAVLYVGYSALIGFLVFILTGKNLFLASGVGNLSNLRNHANQSEQDQLGSLLVGRSCGAYTDRSRWIDLSGNYFISGSVAAVAGRAYLYIAAVRAVESDSGPREIHRQLGSRLGGSRIENRELRIDRGDSCIFILVFFLSCLFYVQSMMGRKAIHDY